jgi:CDP-glucose 4,6-dehydratase
MAYLKAAKLLHLKKIQGEAFNISNEKPLSVKKITELIFKTCKADISKIEILNNAKCEIRAQYLNSKKARKMLKWRPSCNISQGLVKTAEWYRARLG